MWWIYFDIGAERGSHRIAHAADPGRLARIAYTYIHLLIVAGMIVGAVAEGLSPLLLSAGVAVVLIVVAVRERLSLRGGQALSSPEIG